MKRPTFRAGVETLEAREVPSTAAASVAHAIPIHGRGTGVVVSQTAIPNGSYETVTDIKGTSRALGAFAAQIVLDFAPNQHTIQAGEALLIDQAGDQLLTNVSGSFRVPRHGATHTSGTLRFTIMDGSGAFAGTTGGGHIFVSQNVSNGNLKFTIDGSARH